MAMAFFGLFWKAQEQMFWSSSKFPLAFAYIPTIDALKFRNTKMQLY